MKIFKLSLLLATLGLFAFVPGKDPKVNFEGKVVYTITYEDLPEEYEAYASMLPKEMTMFISNQKARIEQNTGMGSTITIVDNDKKEMILLMDMMGTKSAYKGKTEEAEDKSPAPKIEYTTDTKTIAGYACNKAIVTVEGEEPSTIWYTKELPAGLSKNVKGLDGFPMEYSVSANGMVMVMAVSSIKKEKVPSSYFSIPDGYEVKSMDELKKMTGGK